MNATLEISRARSVVGKVRVDTVLLSGLRLPPLESYDLARKSSKAEVMYLLRGCKGVI